MRLTVKLFGSLREEVGTNELPVEIPAGARVEDVRTLMAERLPAFERFSHRLAASVNLRLVGPEFELSEGDEVAFLPPVAGGAGESRRAEPESGRQCTISDRPLDERAVAERVVGPDTGGVVSFVGTVRDRARGHVIEHLEYEAYPEMAEREMQKIADEAAERWPGTRLSIAHRMGRLEVGEAAVVIVAAAPHRAAAFEASRFAIDTLKQTVPIWKKEVATDGEYWVDDHA
jgi:molybdopterin synthase catalytic subunit/molybdopterin converting factor small subunit